MQKAIAYSRWTAGLLVVYKLVLDLLYWDIVCHSVSKSWWGTFHKVDLTLAGYFSAWIVCGAIIFLFRETLQKPLEKYRFSELILFVLLFLSVIPGMAMCGMGAFPWEYRWMFYLYWMLFFLLEQEFSVIKLRGPITNSRLSLRAKKGLLFFVGVVAVLSVIFVFFYYGSGQFFFFGIFSPEVYVQRAQFQKTSMAFPLSYIMANVVIIFLFLFLVFLKQRRYGWAGIVMLAWYMKFSCDVHKIELVLMLVGILVYATRNYLTTERLVYIAIGIVVVGMGILCFWNKVYMMSFLYRTMIETNWLSYGYYDFFQNHAPMLYYFWDVPVLNRGTIPFMIGAQYLDNSVTHANNGLLGDACMMAGVYGIIVGPVLWHVYLYFLDRVGNRVDWWMKLAASVYWAVIMQNGAFTTSMLSHGGVAMIVLASLCNEDNRNQGGAQTVEIRVI